jgi:hypothetical protein
LHGICFLTASIALFIRLSHVLGLSVDENKINFILNPSPTGRWSDVQSDQYWYYSILLISILTDAEEKDDQQSSTGIIVRGLTSQRQLHWSLSLLSTWHDYSLRSMNLQVDSHSI